MGNVRTRRNINTDVDQDDDDTQVMPVVNKTSTKGQRLILMEDDGTASDSDIPHSGVIENGRAVYDKLPVRGGMIINSIGEVVNHKGHEIDPDTGEVIDPSRYAEESNTGL